MLKSVKYGGKRMRKTKSRRRKTVNRKRRGGGGNFLNEKMGTDMLKYTTNSVKYL